MKAVDQDRGADPVLRAMREGVRVETLVQDPQHSIVGDLAQSQNGFCITDLVHQPPGTTPLNLVSGRLITGWQTLDGIRDADPSGVALGVEARACLQAPLQPVR